jgi:hypothetical protein
MTATTTALAIDDQLTPFLLEQLTVAQLVKKFPAFQGAQSFITVLTTARPAHLILPSVDDSNSSW